MILQPKKLGSSSVLSGSQIIGFEWSVLSRLTNGVSGISGKFSRTTEGYRESLSVASLFLIKTMVSRVLRGIVNTCVAGLETLLMADADPHAASVFRTS